MHSWAVLCKSLSRLRLTNSGIPDLEKFAELFVGLHLLLRKKDSSFVTFVVVIFEENKFNVTICQKLSILCRDVCRRSGR